MAEHFGHQGGRGLLSSMSCGVAGPAGLLQEELKCPICVETIQDAFVTACGHTFCYPCISTHLKNKHSCPSCSNYLTQEHIHPNFLLNKVSGTKAEQWQCFSYQCFTVLASVKMTACAPFVHWDLGHG